jgi:hypothetical protein
MIDVSEKLFTVTVYHKLKNNNNGQTKHWSSSAKERKAWMNALKNADVETETGLVFPVNEFLAEVLRGRPVQQRVGVIVHRALGPRERHWDADSTLRGTAKQLIDSLVEFGFLTDDNPKCIKWCVGTQSSERSDESHTQIVFYGAE